MTKNRPGTSMATIDICLFFDEELLLDIDFQVPATWSNGIYIVSSSGNIP